MIGAGWYVVHGRGDVWVRWSDDDDGDYDEGIGWGMKTEICGVDAHGLEVIDIMDWVAVMIEMNWCWHSTADDEIINQLTWIDEIR